MTPLSLKGVWFQKWGGHIKGPRLKPWEFCFQRLYTFISGFLIIQHNTSCYDPVMIKTDNKHILTYVSSLLYMAVHTVTEDNSTELAIYPNNRAWHFFLPTSGISRMSAHN